MVNYKYVHAMYARCGERVKRDLQQGLTFVARSIDPPSGASEGKIDDKKVTIAAKASG